MRYKVAPEEAGRMLRSTAQLIEAGMSERRLHGMVARGELVRLRRGWFVSREQWNGLWPEGRHLLRLLAVARDSGEGCLAAGVSAAVLWDLPFYRIEPRKVHMIVPMPRQSKTTAHVVRHHVEIADRDIVLRHGIRCTSLGRTVLDLACQLSPEAALAAADAAMRMLTVAGASYDQERAGAWRAELSRAADASSARDIRQARRIISFCDGRAQLPGESVSRLQLHRLGFRRISLQVPIPRPRRDPFFVDFGLDDVGVLAEFDGEGKYLDPALRGDRGTAEVVLEEKRREDWIRGVTQKPFVRWGYSHILTSRALGDRLAAFGVSPPG